MDDIFITDTPLWYEPLIGPPVHIQLSYNSQAIIVPEASFGRKWTFNYGSHVAEEDGGNVAVTMPDGRIDVFVPDGQGGYTKPAGVFTSLTKIASNHFELMFLDGTVQVYNNASATHSEETLLSEIRDVYGQKLTFGYNSDRLVTITDALSRITNILDLD